MTQEAINELELFAGAGGGILGSKLLGWKTVCAVEIEQYARNVLIARQNDGFIEPFPIWDDVRTFDGKPWNGFVDVVSGGFPCQDISCAGKGAGIKGKRSGLWSEMARIIGEVQPQFVFVENVPLLVKRGLAVVLGDFAEMGFDARWCRVSAENVGAPHKRDRLWILAYTIGKRSNAGTEQSGRQARSNISRRGEGAELANSPGKRCGKTREHCERPEERTAGGGEWWDAEPDVGRVVDELAHRVDRLKAIGNGQVPLAKYAAWRILSEGLT